MIRFALLLLMSLVVSSQTIAAVKWNNSSNQPQQVEIIAPPGYVVPKVNFNGNHYRAGLRMVKICFAVEVSYQQK